MAIDTDSKKKSSLDFGFFGLSLPIAVIDQATMQHTLASYFGILASEVLVSLGYAGFKMRIDSVSMNVQVDAINMDIQVDSRNMRVVV